MLAKLKYIYTINGRISRLSYWKNTLYVGALQIGILFVLMFLGSAGISNRIITLIAIISGAAALVYLMTVAIRRLHDRNKGVLTWLIYLIAPNVVGFAGKSTDTPILNVLAELMALWIIVDIGVLSGTAGENAYGPAPGDSNPMPRI